MATTQCSCPGSPRAAEPGGVPSVGSLSRDRDWAGLAATVQVGLRWIKPDVGTVGIKGNRNKQSV